MISRIVSTTDIVAVAPCSVPGDISRAVAGTGRGNYQAAVQEDQEGRGQGAGEVAPGMQTQ